LQENEAIVLGAFAIKIESVKCEINEILPRAAEEVTKG